MIDLTINEKDKDFFITGLEISEDYKTYTVTYASGRKEIYPFSVHNYNADIHHMENQYFQYKDAYENEILEITKDVMVNKVKYLLESAIVCLLMFNITDNTVIRMLTVLIVLLNYLKRKKDNKNTLIICGTSIEYLKQIDRYFESKEQLKVPVIDPMNKQQEDWYLVNLSNVEETLFHPEIYKELANNLNEDVKEELGEAISKSLNGEIEEDMVYTMNK